MSLYPQSQSYGQVSYPPMGFTQSNPPPTAYRYPPPLPQPYHADPQTFRRDYLSHLAELTVNSRPVIQNLSMIAQEYSQFADVVTQCIEAHIRRVPAWMKLPAFYLLDAISKNVFDPYARLFSTVVVRLFIDTYEQVDVSIRSKMIEMLTTWRNGAPNGKELFGVINQIAIERHVWPEDSTRNVASSSRHQAVPPVSTPQVLSELEFVLGQKERAIQSNPYDKTLHTHVTVLQQLRKLVQAGVAQDELIQILGHLRALAPAALPVTPAPIPAPGPLLPPHNDRHSFVHGAKVYPPHDATHHPQYQYSQPAHQPTHQRSKAEVPDVTDATIVPAVGDITSLYSALVKAGVVSASGVPAGTEITPPSETPQFTEKLDTSIEFDRQYRETVLAVQVKLNSSDIMKQRAPLAQSLYDQLPSQCKQCGIRFCDTPSGKQKMQDHLDMHFRQNRKAGQPIGRGHSRGWYTSAEDWAHDGVIDVKGKGRADPSRPVSAKAATANAVRLEAELRALFVVIPPGDEAKPISCPICKDSLKAEFVEDDEEWVWKNAVKRDDKIFHATCHAEASVSKSNLAVRLRGELSSRSRSRTPETAREATPKVESPSPSRGTKRKAEDGEKPNVTPLGQSETAPPAKKLAILSSADIS